MKVKILTPIGSTQATFFMELPEKLSPLSQEGDTFQATQPSRDYYINFTRTREGYCSSVKGITIDDFNCDEEILKAISDFEHEIARRINQ